MNTRRKFQLYFDTIRYLRPVQIYRRILFKLPSKPPLSTPISNQRTYAADKWVLPAKRRQSLFAKNTFEFLNERKSLDKTGWNNPDVEKLWLYNLHYFDDLNAEKSGKRCEQHTELIQRWINDNPPTIGNGWEPYPSSLRIVNWVKWHLTGNTLQPTALQNLAQQTRWLRKRLEYHLLGNHLFANAKALIFSGLLFEGDEADHWLDTGLTIIQKQVKEQILPDGGHFELSTMYHALALEDVLDLINILRTYSTTPHKGLASVLLNLESHVASMRVWLQTMCHPDGEISFFNDAAIGIAPSPSELESYAQKLGFSPLPQNNQTIHALADSGYIRVQQPEMTAFLDVAKIGPDYLPGHAHADTLSFEMSLFGQRVFVNSGTSCYGSSPERTRQRGTANHNTVTISGENSSEVWSSFRVARRAKPCGLKIDRKNGISIECAHNGFHRVSGRPRHIRKWEFKGKEVMIFDEVLAPKLNSLAYFHFHPDTKITWDQDQQSGCITVSSGKTAMIEIKTGSAQLSSATYHPEFGLSQDCKCLIISLSNGLSAVKVSW